tara:strand:+ start:171 stop:737 length:567 start_codon:yes stop_codon:yes gene_type:complete
MPITINGSGTITGLSDGGLGLSGADMPAGAVIQVVSAEKSDTNSTTGNSWADTGLTASITPTSSSNKILVMCDYICGAANNGYGQMRLVRTISSTDVVVNKGDTSGSRLPSLSSRFYYASYGSTYDGIHESSQFLDTPNTTSAVAYKLQFRSNLSSGHTAYINRNGNDADRGEDPRTASHINLLEIKV